MVTKEIVAGEMVATISTTEFDKMVIKRMININIHKIIVHLM